MTRVGKCAVYGCGQVSHLKFLCTIHAHEFLDALEESTEAAEKWIDDNNVTEPKPDNT